MDITSYEIELTQGGLLRVDVLAPHLFRVRLDAVGDLRDGALNRYGVLRRDWPAVEVTVRKRRGEVILATAAASLSVRRDDGRLCLRDAQGRTLLATPEAPRSQWDSGFRVAFSLAADELLYGLGDESRDRIQKRGHAGSMVLRNVASYVPIPFLMSTGGWAVFVNTTWFHRVDAGAGDRQRLVFAAEQGGLDLYLLVGDSLPRLLDRYTELSGRPHLLPLSGYGLTFVCDERGVRARDVLYEAYEFRRQQIPCDTIGLEPDWMEQHYDFSVNKEWSKERFHIPFWLERSSHSTFAAGLANMGFKLSLWLCCDYDVSEHEERLLGRDWNPMRAADLGPQREATIQDPHLVPTYTDRITKTGVAWFDHLKRFVDDGASAFKLDGSNQVNFHPDRKWRNGMEDAEMHNLYPLLLNKQMSLGFKDYTGRRAMIYSAGGYAGIQQYSATWAGDTGGNAGPLISLLNHGLSGHSNTSCDMEVWSATGIHFGFFQPWSQVLSWHMYNQPWFQGMEMLALFTYYARLRYRLLPYIYSAAHVAARCGLPILRAMPLVAPDDPECAERTLQYMFGEAFLTCAFTDRIYLPAGRWIDYWTGTAHDGPGEIPCAYPADRGGVLFVKAGAIIPMWPPVDHVGASAVPEISLDVYPWGQSSFTLYEDDGVSYAYQQGRVAETRCECRQTRQMVQVTLHPRRGDYDGMPARRTYQVHVHLAAPPRAVTLSGRAVEAAYVPATGILTVAAAEDPERAMPAMIRIRL
jgi:alpha-glucosidase (family GH31 glycosyl hydrolase)